MRKYLFLSILAIFSSQVLADSVLIRLASPHSANAINGTSYSLYIDEPTAANSEAAPFNIYVPTGNTSVPTQNEYFYLSRSGKTVLDVTTVNRTTMAIIFPLLVNIGGTAKYVSLAAKVNGAWKLVGQSASTYSSINSDIDFNISPAEICTTFTFGSTNPCSASVAYNADILTYAFVTNVALAQGDAADPATYTSGVYFNVRLSNRISTITSTITAVRNGDKRATLQFTSSAVLSNGKSVKVYDFDGNDPAIPTAGETVGSQTSGNLLSDDITYAQTGEIVARNLTNGLPYIFSVTFVDKYGFATLLSPNVSASPMAIEELLKKNQCFLLTAGFGEEHFVINYFRHFRDTILVKSFLGREFIHFYYELAPKYALLLYKSETLRMMVRGTAYILYFLFNYYLLILAGAVISASSIYLFKKREKIKI